MSNPKKPNVVITAAVPRKRRRSRNPLSVLETYEKRLRKKAKRKMRNDPFYRDMKLIREFGKELNMQGMLNKWAKKTGWQQLAD